MKTLVELSFKLTNHTIQLRNISIMEIVQVMSNFTFNTGI